MKDYHVAHQMLIHSTQKLIQIFNEPAWKKELLEKAPPVLWFGNSNTPKPVILTLGANPSDKEFVQHDKINYLQKDKQRFRHLKDDENFTTILQSEQLRNEIIQRYVNYFSQNPYTKWFGKNTDKPYNLEGFLRGIDASFYDDSPTIYQACHIDIFPFATRSDFTTIEKLIEQEFLHNGWSKNLLLKLFDFFQPKMLIVTGKNNLQTFMEIFCENIDVQHIINYHGGHSSTIKIIKIKNYHFPVVGLSLNLGNPRGFSKDEIFELGKFVKISLTNIAL